MKKMHRTQLYLPKSQHAALGRIAARKGVTLSEIVRRAVDEGLRTCRITAPRSSKTGGGEE